MIWSSRLERGTHMMTELEEREGLAFAEEDSELAASASRALARAKDSLVKVTLDDGTELTLPKAVRELLIRILTEVSHGNMVNLVPVHAELSTQEAANLLNVSRPYLVKLLERGDIPYHKAGSHRRVKFSDLRAYQEAQERAREDAMSELAREAQELGMGY
jgi:excisionase family DNA binding protein